MLVDLLTSTPTSHYQTLGRDGSVADEATGAQVRSDAVHLARQLLDQGSPGDRVVIPPLVGLDFERAFFGVVAAGMVAVPVRTLDQEGIRFVAALAETCRPTTMVVGNQRQREAAEELGLATVEVAHRSTSDLAEASLPATPEPGGTVLLQFTSGSTGAPKGVSISQENLVANITQMAAVSTVTATTDIVAWLPSHHNLGLCAMTILPALSGATLVRIPTGDFVRRPLDWLRAMSGRPDVWSAAPDFGYRSCVRALRMEGDFEADLSGWRVAGSGSEPVREGTLREFELAFEEYGFRSTAFCPGYGLAESTVLVTVLDPAATRRTLRVSPSALAAGHVEVVDPQEPAVSLVGCGRPFPGMELTIRDPEQLVELGPREVGEICLSGPSTASGYWDDPDASRETFVARDDEPTLLRTGDLGFVEQGELFVCGRRKDIVIHGGDNYFASDLEDVAFGDLGDAGGVTSACFQTLDGIAHLVHEVDPSTTHQEGVERCQAALKALSRVYPGQAVVVAVPTDQIPRTSSGKVQRGLSSRKWQSGGFVVVATSKDREGGRND